MIIFLLVLKYISETLLNTLHITVSILYFNSININVFQHNKESVIVSINKLKSDVIKHQADDLMGEKIK